MTMPISECCNKRVVSCTADATLPEVAALMRKHHVGDVVVVENKDGGQVPVGIVTDRDIVIEAIALDLDAEVFTAGDMMTTPVLSVREDEGFVETLRLMRHHRVRRMPVVTASDSLYGIVTADDIINLLALELSLMTGAIAQQPTRERKLRK
jgi:CBS domain-containing protein